MSLMLSAGQQKVALSDEQISTLTPSVLLDAANAAAIVHAATLGDDPADPAPVSDLNPSAASGGANPSEGPQPAPDGSDAPNDGGVPAPKPDGDP